MARRFRPPQDVLDWRRSGEGDDVRDATAAPASCVQRRDYFFAGFAGATAGSPRGESRSKNYTFFSEYLSHTLKY